MYHQSRHPDLSLSSETVTSVKDDQEHRSTTLTLPRRTITVFDAVAGRVGLNGFLSSSQLDSTNFLPSSPDDVLLRRVNAPDKISSDFYDAVERLSPSQKLPDSDLLKALHAYTSDYYYATTSEKGNIDFQTFDGSALLALGILLEEAAKEALGEAGDMTMVEREGLESGPLTSKTTKHQIVGRVKSRHVEQRQMADTNKSDGSIQEESPRKRMRAER